VTKVSGRPTADGGITRLAVARLQEAGIAPDPLLQVAGLDPKVIADPKIRIPVRSQVDFLERATVSLNDALLGFHLALDLDPRRIGLLYFTMASSATLGDAFERAERYSTIMNEGIVLRCDRAIEHAVRYTYVGVPRHLDRQQIEFWATALVRIARELTVTALHPLRVSLVHHRSDVSDALDAYLGCRVEFGSEHDEIVFARGACDAALTNADPYLSELLVGYCEEALAHRARPAAVLRTRVENALAPLLPHGKARVREVARELGIGQRTLSRRLAAEHLTFSVILDETRADLARRHLRDTSLSISQIAWMLGFQEVSAFTHAFKRWTGRTPTAARSAPDRALEASDGPAVEPLQRP
jgi:AraC-like DNA-binding protein